MNCNSDDHWCNSGQNIVGPTNRLFELFVWFLSISFFSLLDLNPIHKIELMTGTVNWIKNLWLDPFYDSKITEEISY